jgi:hypothetical protein
MFRAVFYCSIKQHSGLNCFTWNCIFFPHTRFRLVCKCTIFYSSPYLRMIVK